MPDGGRLTVQTANASLDRRAGRESDLQPGDYVGIAVTDTRQRHATRVLGRAFDPFYTTKPVGQGTGLGLSMIYGFAKQSGGQARLKNSKNRAWAPPPGSTCRAISARPMPRTPVPALAHATRAGTGETVFVVDDEASIRMLVAEVLEELGYAAIEAADGGSRPQGPAIRPNRF